MRPVTLTLLVNLDMAAARVFFFFFFFFKYGDGLHELRQNAIR